MSEQDTNHGQAADRASTSTPALKANALAEMAAEIERLRTALAEAEHRAAVLEARLESANYRATRAETHVLQLEKHIMLTHTEQAGTDAAIKH